MRRRSVSGRNTPSRRLGVERRPFHNGPEGCAAELSDGKGEEMVDALIASLDDRIRDRVVAVRRLAREHGPMAEEAASGRRIFYRVGSRPVLTVWPLADSVTVGFFQAEGLPDPTGLLEGEGPNRHVKLWGGKAIPEEKLARLVSAAFQNAA